MTTLAGDDDVMARATGALRGEQDAVLGGRADDRRSVAGDPTWFLIVSDVRRARRRGRWMSAIALQLAVLLGATGVWAAVTGRLAALVEAPASLFAPKPATEAPATSAAGRSHGRAPQPAPEPPPAPAEEAPPPDVVDAPSVRAPIPTRAPPATGPVRAPAEVAPSLAVQGKDAAADSAPLTDAAGGTAIALYRTAHALHFRQRDFAAALAAWDRYLASGTGSFAIEAQYNRAIALAHLGRATEATAALRPFADGTHGSYRQKEARALIVRLATP